MASFTQPVSGVSGTRIFARVVNDRQFLVFSTSVRATGNLALVLPLPVPPGSGADAVRFHDLSLFPEIFVHLQELFQNTGAMAVRGSLGRELMENTPALESPVEKVSFLPGRKAFETLEPCDRLSAAAWTSRPGWSDFGFVVASLRLGSSAGNEAAHIPPIAVEFPTRRAGEIFFPTIADDTLYLQSHSGGDALASAEIPWQEGGSDPNAWLAEESGGVIAPRQAVYRARLPATGRNAGLWVRP